MLQLSTTVTDSTANLQTLQQTQNQPQKQAIEDKVQTATVPVLQTEKPAQTEPPKQKKVTKQKSRKFSTFSGKKPEPATEEIEEIKDTKEVKPVKTSNNRFIQFFSNFWKNSIRKKDLGNGAAVDVGGAEAT
jgi:hypothetical protein